MRVGTSPSSLSLRSATPDTLRPTGSCVAAPRVARRAKRGGGRRTRTFEVIRRLIYSQLPLPLGTLPRSTPSQAFSAETAAERPWMTLKPDADGGPPVGRVYEGNAPTKSTKGAANKRHV